MKQGFALFSILLILYIILLICIFEIRAQALNLSTSIFLFVDDGLLISQKKTCNIILPKFDNCYRVVTDLIVLFSLVIKYDKLEIFIFLEHTMTLIQSWTS